MIAAGIPRLPLISCLLDVSDYAGHFMAPFHEIFSQLQSKNRDAFYKDKGTEAKWEMACTKVDLNGHISQLISD